MKELQLEPSHKRQSEAEADQVNEQSELAPTKKGCPQQNLYNIKLYYINAGIYKISNKNTFLKFGPKT